MVGFFDNFTAVFIYYLNKFCFIGSAHIPKVVPIGLNETGCLDLLAAGAAFSCTGTVTSLAGIRNF